MNFNVIVLPEAKDDLIEIYWYVSKHDSVLRAEALLEKTEDKCASLAAYPERGHFVPELRRIHAEGFREIHCKPYRIIYQIMGKNIYIHAVLDGRRELHELLERRILR